MDPSKYYNYSLQIKCFFTDSLPYRSVLSSLYIFVPIPMQKCTRSRQTRRARSDAAGTAGRRWERSAAVPAGRLRLQPPDADGGRRSSIHLLEAAREDYRPPPLKRDWKRMTGRSRRCTLRRQLPPRPYGEAMATMGGGVTSWRRGRGEVSGFLGLRMLRSSSDFRHQGCSW